MDNEVSHLEEKEKKRKGTHAQQQQWDTVKPSCVHSAIFGLNSFFFFSSAKFEKKKKKEI